MGEELAYTTYRVNDTGLGYQKGCSDHDSEGLALVPVD